MSKTYEEIIKTKDLKSLTHLEYCIWYTAVGVNIYHSKQAAAELAAFIAETNHRFVVCTYCGWRLDYESEQREAAYESANTHALECEKDPRNAELAALTTELETVKRERDAAIALLSKMAKEEPCDNDGRGCPCVEMAYEFVAALKAGKA